MVQTKGKKKKKKRREREREATSIRVATYFTSLTHGVTVSFPLTNFPNPNNRLTRLLNSFRVSFFLFSLSRIIMEEEPQRGEERIKVPGMEMHLPEAEVDPASSSSAIWDWSDLLDFTVDENFPLSFDSDNLTPPLFDTHPEVPAPAADRVRKRDPRLACVNFLAGRVPCACPEVDEKLEEEEAAMPGKKRPRTARAGTARCQVAGCEADISELKGYHRRHRVCLRCANASTVLIDGETKRYCQQCGKFHILSDFDEGKRSCRRKLERHNNRRRRKPVDAKVRVDKESQAALPTEEIACDGEAVNDGVYLSSQVADEEAPESEDGHLSTLHSAPKLQNVNSDSVVSFVASGGTEMDGRKDDFKYSLSPSDCDNKTSYSSVCPTGRISFKLYDWNPAEFPRRLRQQILQWLANMPIELEGYIRPGCTILTVFIAMPKNMWMELSENPVSYLQDFVLTPGRMLYGRGSMTVYFNDMIFCTRKDATSILKVNLKLRAPRLHYIHPPCFEAGKPMEFIACGSNLLQPKFRFLVSFAGKYLACDNCVSSSHVQSKGDASSCDHQIFKIHVPHTEPHLFGPAFVEVENESGLSNFIPVLIGDKEICSEMKSLHKRFKASFFPKASKVVAGRSLSELCEASTMMQASYSELVLDIAWLLKDPTLENLQEIMSSSEIQRFNCLLNFLIHSESTVILERILQNLKIMMEKRGLDAVNGTNDADTRLLYKYMDYATDVLHRNQQKAKISTVLSENAMPQRSWCSRSVSESDKVSVSVADQVLGTSYGKLGVVVGSNASSISEAVPFLSKEVVMNVNLSKDSLRKPCNHVFSITSLRSRPTVFLIATTAVVCFGLCAVFFHPHKLGEFAVTIRRSLFDKL